MNNIFLKNQYNEIAPVVAQTESQQESIIKNYILANEYSYLMTDTDLKIYKGIKEILKGKGYDVYSWSFRSDDNSISFDPMRHIVSSTDAIAIANSIIMQGNNDSGSSMDRNALIILSGIIYCYYSQSILLRKPCTLFNDVFNMCGQLDNSINLNDIIWGIDDSKSSVSLNEIISYINSKNQLLKNNWNCNNSFNNEIDFSILAKKKVAIFLDRPSNDRSFDYLNELLLFQARQTLEAVKSNCEDQSLLVPVNMIFHKN